MIIVGTAGTAGLIRTMRANMLDEINQPYVETARAKGLSERSPDLEIPCAGCFESLHEYGRICSARIWWVA